MTTEEGLQSPASDEITGPPGVPFMPSVGADPAPSRGIFLDLALLSQVRAWTLDVTNTSVGWTSELEVTPGIALEVVHPVLTLSLGYAPRLTVPFDVGGFDLAILNRATLRSAWRVDSLWTVTALGIFVVGDYSQLVPASTPGGAGPTPPVLNPVRSFETYPYVGIDTWAVVEGALSPRSRIRVAGGYFDVGGVGEVGQANQPRTWGPQAEASFAWDGSRETSTLTTAIAARNWMMEGDFNIIVATLTEAWRQAWTKEFEVTLSAGPGLANRDVESLTAVGHLVPVANLRFDYRSESRDRLRISLDAGLAPYVDPYIRTVYQRVTVSGSIDWRPSDAWGIGALISAGLAPYAVQAPESFGTAGFSANYAPVPFLILSAGGFSQAQFQGQTESGGAFRQWTAYFSLAFRDRFSL